MEYLALSANTNESKSESEPEDATASNKPKTFALSTNVHVALHSTDHTATNRSNLEDDANRVPIFGSAPLGENTDYMSTQIVEETQVSTPKKPTAAPGGNAGDEVPLIPESPHSSLFRLMPVKEETQIKPVTLNDPKDEPLTEDIKPALDMENEEKDDLLSALFDSSDEQQDDVITPEAKNIPSDEISQPQVVLSFTESTKSLTIQEPDANKAPPPKEGERSLKRSLTNAFDGVLNDDLFGDPNGSPFKTDLSKSVAGLFGTSEGVPSQAGSQPPRSVDLFPPTQTATFQDQSNAKDPLPNDFRDQKKNEPVELLDTPAPKGLRPPSVTGTGKKTTRRRKR